jgi:hypothetical protein
MGNAVLIGALLVVSIIAATLWVTRPKCDVLGALEKGYELGVDSVDAEREGYDNWNNQDIPGSFFKFRRAKRRMFVRIYQGYR